MYDNSVNGKWIISMDFYRINHKFFCKKILTAKFLFHFTHDALRFSQLNSFQKTITVQRPKGHVDFYKGTLDDIYMNFSVENIGFFIFTISAMHITFNVRNESAKRWCLHLYGICHALPYIYTNIPVSQPLVCKQV